MKTITRYALALALALALMACGAPSAPEAAPRPPEVASPLGGAGGAGGANTASTAGSGGAICADACGLKVEPRPAHSPVPVPYTGIPVVACTADADCQAVAECRHTACDTDCGFCMFLDAHPCMVDGCQGHNTTCQSPAECTDSAFYATECIEGRCLVMPPPASGYDCAAPGQMYHEED